MADYRYDAFVSYRSSNQLVATWVTQFFADNFKSWLTEELGGNEAQVFLDRESIEVGDDWPKRLHDAVRDSRCLVAILTPAYFKSEWCRWEWGSFEERLNLVGRRCDLIAPIALHDGDWFPPDVKTLQHQDFRRFFRTGSAFRDSPLFLEFESAVQRLAHRVAAMVRVVPPAPPGGWPVAQARQLIPPPISQPLLQVA